MYLIEDSHKSETKIFNDVCVQSSPRHCYARG